jgi:hypothetical protein
MSANTFFDNKTTIPILTALLITLSGYFFSNTDDAITKDAIAEIKNDIAEIKEDMGSINFLFYDHQAAGAHPEASTNIDNIKDTLKSLESRIRDLEKGN